MIIRGVAFGGIGVRERGNPDGGNDGNVVKIMKAADSVFEFEVCRFLFHISTPFLID